LARHFLQGRTPQRAVQYFQYASENALRRSAHQEAIDHLTKGLELLTMLPDTPERTQQELTLHLVLGPAYIVTRGQAAPEVEQVYLRAQALCQQLGARQQLLPVLKGLWTVYNGRLMYRQARVLGEQYLALAQQEGDPVVLLEAYVALGTTLFRLGELAAACQHFEAGFALYDPYRDRSRAVSAGQDPGVVCLTFLASVLVFLGYPEHAQRRTAEALRLAQELAHPYSQVFAQYRAGLHALFCREVPAARERADAVLSLATTHSFSFFTALGTALRGWAVAMQGQGEEGLALMQQGLNTLTTTGAPPSTHWVALQAELYGMLGRTTEALSLLRQALAFADTTAELFYVAELYRLKGELLLEDHRHRSPENGQPLAEAETCFQHAVALARQQQGKFLELRAAMSLSRLWQKHGKDVEARQLLAEVYGWFTEGFDTADLRDARALLEALGG
jgi:tetratricopeptide (TPR) repeat protein